MSETENRRGESRRSPTTALGLLMLSVTLLPTTQPSVAVASDPPEGGVTYLDIAFEPGSGLVYDRAGSSSLEAVDDLYQRSLEAPVGFEDIIESPMMPWGLPGVAIFDHDLDGDLDLYVTNGEGHPNSLFSSQLRESGMLWFVDRAIEAGVDLPEQDSFGVCFGDVDNDGDSDLFVLGRKGPNRILENLGDGTFLERGEAGVGGGTKTSSSCSFGDIDNDGLLDVAVGNSFDMTFSRAILVEPFAENQHNFLYRNRGDWTFEDVSESSGIRVHGGYPEGAAGITWATMMADVDRDGDADVVFLDDQGAILPARAGGLDRGFIHVFMNDGSGRFTDQPILLDENSAAEWMGVDIGDLDCDGHLDLFAASFGDYGNPSINVASTLNHSRPFLGVGDGTFTDPLLTRGPESSVFGWGVGIYDYDNDADLDVLYHGGLDAGNMSVISDNPGALLRNRGACSGMFELDQTAIERDHLRRNVRALALADLDEDGFVDVVTAANFVVPPEVPWLPSPVGFDSPFDATAGFYPFLGPVDGGFRWLGFEKLPGDLAVELARGNENASVTVEVRGGAGLLDESGVNRDGIGAVLTFHPAPSAENPEPRPVTQVVTGGASHSSQHALERLFGLGRASHGTLDVLWPGGVRNRLYDVEPGRVLMPEIPCSLDGDWSSGVAYRQCVRSALLTYREQGIVSGSETGKLFGSAMRAFVESRR